MLAFFPNFSLLYTSPDFSYKLRYLVLPFIHLKINFVKCQTFVVTKKSLLQKIEFWAEHKNGTKRDIMKT